MKKTLTLIIVILSVFLIYLGCKENKIHYLSLGDYMALGYNNLKSKDYGYYDYLREYLQQQNKLKKSYNYASFNKRSIDLINEIKDNKKINGTEKTIQNALIKSDIITLSVGMNDMFENINNDYSKKYLYEKFNNVILELEKLFKLIRIYSKEKIIFIGFFSEDEELNTYMDKILNETTKKYDIDYLKISDMVNKKNDITNDTHMQIFNKIVDMLDKNTKNT